jgi:phosphatidylserine decarboxylase
MNIIILLLYSFVFSSFLYYYLHFKTRIDLKHLYLDNIVVVALSVLIQLFVWKYLITSQLFLQLLFQTFTILSLIVLLGLYRFYRTPKRKITAKENEVVSPADGKVIYIKYIESNTIPVSIKNGVKISLIELTNTNILHGPCWLIGINMTPFDAHKNCSPIDGIVKQKSYTPGRFHSLKQGIALKENERNTLVINNGSITIGITQIASRLVRKIECYVNEGVRIKKGDWFGMIKFGSQVDTILPSRYDILIKVGQQVFAGISVLAVYRS